MIAGTAQAAGMRQKSTEPLIHLLPYKPIPCLGVRGIQSGSWTSFLQLHGHEVEREGCLGTITRERADMLQPHPPVLDPEQRSRVARSLAGQRRILEMIALGEPLDEILKAITVLIENESDGLLCTILTLD